MPTIEFYGYDEAERRQLEREVRDRLKSELFHRSCVFVTAAPNTVRDWNGSAQPFIRVSTRSAQRAERFKTVLSDVCDLEVVRIDFQPMTPASAPAVSHEQFVRSDRMNTDMPVDENFEFRLVEALQPIRGFALAQGIYHLFESGLYERIADGASGVEDLAKELDADPERLAGYFRYLANENVVALNADTVSLTSRSQDLATFRPWYELLVGGYAETFQQISGTLRRNDYAGRNGAMVGIGSCGISQYDALPLVRQLVEAMPEAPKSIVDLGCGDGQFLMGLLQGLPGTVAVGVDPYAPTGEDDERVRFLQASAVDHVRALVEKPEDGGPRRLFLTAFLLQEVLEQQGRPAVVQMVKDIVRDGSYLAVVEVDHRPDDPAVMRHGLGLGYYNPYYLLHVLTEQRLETRRFWLELFDEAGAVVVSQRSVDPRVDSTELEFGCLLTRRDGASR